MATSSAAVVRGFLFTDVEGSTRLWESDSEAMSLSLATHDEIIRSSVESGGGLVFSTAGDSFAAAFETPGAAVACAVEAQTRLNDAEWPGPRLAVRMGIHSGGAEERGGDFFGLSVNRAARIMAAGNGGQILVSWLAAQGLDSGIELRDLGTHHLKDLADPEHVFEVRHPDLPPVETPIRTVDVRRDNLPEYLTSFVGRSEELVEVGRLVEANRLVTLTGVGGTGKTRLAVEAASSIGDRFPDGVWMLELAPITNPAGVIMALIDTLGLQSGEGLSAEDAVVGHLRQRRSLLIVDNCEHLLESAGGLIKLLLDRCPEQRVLATSREELGLAGERTLRVPSLPFPRETLDGDESEALRLFSDRAQSARGVELAADEMLDAIRVCRRVDGIPLGIELAAARLRSISVAELADRLDQSFRVLSGSKTASLPRQRTLQATIDWSYDLLEPREQVTFRRLAVFVGGFDLEAATAVCADDEADAWLVEDDVDALVGKSLVVPMGVVAGATRFRLLEPLRQYGQERLKDAGEAESVRGLHADFFRRLAARASPLLNGSDQLQWARRLEVETDNLRAAFATLLESEDFDRYLDMVFDMYTYWVHRGNDIDGVEIGLAGLNAAPADSDPMRLIKAYWTTSELASQFNRADAVDLAENGLAVAEASAGPNEVGRMKLMLGTALPAAGREESGGVGYLDHIAAGFSLLRSHPEPYWWDPAWEAGSRSLLRGDLSAMDGDSVRERVVFAAESFESCGDRLLWASALAEGVMCYTDGDRSTKDWVVNSLRMACDVLAETNSNWYAHALYYLGGVLRREGAYGEAIDRLRAGVLRLDACGDRICWASASTILSFCEAHIGEGEAAGGHLVEILERWPIPPLPDEYRVHVVHPASEAMLALGRPGEAGVALGAAMAVEVPPYASPSLPDDLEDSRRRLVLVVGEAEAARLIEQGRSLSIDEACELVAGWLTEV